MMDREYQIALDKAMQDTLQRQEFEEAMKKKKVADRRQDATMKLRSRPKKPQERRYWRQKWVQKLYDEGRLYLPDKPEPERRKTDRHVEMLKTKITVRKGRSRQGLKCFLITCPRGYDIRDMLLDVGFTPAVCVCNGDITMAKTPAQMEPTLRELGLLK